jgi:hypothetical protein
MVIFHSYVSLPEGNYQLKNDDSCPWIDLWLHSGYGNGMKWPPIFAPSGHHPRDMQSL